MPALRQRLRRARRLRHLRHPLRGLLVAVLSTGRMAGRIFMPTGLLVVVAGPDGTGKSTLSRRLPDACGRLFRRSRVLHGRPGLFPRPGALLGKAEPDSTQPHARPPHGRAISSGLLVYYWLDALLGGMLRIWSFRARSGLVVLERGWWDLLVDPRRYRLDPPERLVRLLGRLLPRPDLLLLLDVPATTLAARTNELPQTELARQTEAWRDLSGVQVIDGSQSPADVLGAVREKIVSTLHERAVRRLGAGWVRVPLWAAEPRSFLPRGPRRAVLGALSIYQPITIRSRLGWEAARLGAAVGAFRLLPRAAAPPKRIRDAVAGHVPRRSTIAVSKGGKLARSAVLIVGEGGNCHAVAKVAADDAGRRALAHEAEALSGLADALPAPLTAPRLLYDSAGLLVLEYVPWRMRLRPWRLPTEVARALGEFFAATGGAHGDCAPWNLLRRDASWTLVDWEDARETAPPFYDVLHYLLRGYTYLGRPGRRALRDGLRGRGWVGAVLQAYADGAGLDPELAGEGLRLYLASEEGWKVPDHGASLVTTALQDDDGS